MAARSRPRNGQPREDANEERNIWNQVRNDAKRVDTLTVRVMGQRKALLPRIAPVNMGEGKGKVIQKY